MPFTPVRRPLPHNLQQGSSWATFWGPAPGPICPLQGPSPHQVSGEGAQGPPGHPIQHGWRTLSSRHLGSFTSSSAFVHRKVAWKAASRTHRPWHSPPRPARLTGSQGGGGLNPCTWAATSLLRQVSEAMPGISRSRKRGWGGGAWPLGPRDRGRKEEPCPAAGSHCEAQRGLDKTRAGLSSGAPTQRGASAISLQQACGGQEGRLPFTSACRHLAPRNPQDLSLDVRSDLSSVRWVAGQVSAPRAGCRPAR